MPIEHKPWKTTSEVVPGRIMRSLLIDRFATESQLVARLGVPYDHIDSLLTGASPVTPELASKIGEVLGFDAEFWMGLQEDYENSIRRNIARDAAGINTRVYKMLDEEGRTVKYGMATELVDAWDGEELAGNGVYQEPLTWFLHRDVARRKLDKLQRAFAARKQRERAAADEARVSAQAA